jgi:hypothetical protein
MTQWVRQIIRIVGAIAAIIVSLAIPVWLSRSATKVVEWLVQLFLPLSSGEVFVGIAEIVLVLSVTIYWLWWLLPKRQMRSITAGDPKERADIEDNFRKTIGQALGGIVVLLGAVVAYLQFTQQQNAAHDLLISNQIGKGFEQLGSPQLVVRLGGIYSLEGVMNGSSQYALPVLEALCDFVREGTIGKGTNDKIAPTTDIQAALQVIVRRKPGTGYISLPHVNIPHVYLRGADLTGADLQVANLFHADLIRAKLDGSDLTDAVLRDARLIGANLFAVDLRGADLHGADLRAADLRNANLLTRRSTPCHPFWFPAFPADGEHSGLLQTGQGDADRTASGGCEDGA